MRPVALISDPSPPRNNPALPLSRHSCLTLRRNGGNVKANTQVGTLADTRREQRNARQAFEALTFVSKKEKSE